VRGTGEMENLKIAFEPFIGDSVRRFIDDGINDYNFAVTGMPEYVPANFVLGVGSHLGLRISNFAPKKP
jgi:hypothetical protein